MCDKLEFKIFDPKNVEDWVDIYNNDEYRAVEIYINGEEICSILKRIEYPRTIPEGLRATTVTEHPGGYIVT